MYRQLLDVFTMMIPWLLSLPISKSSGTMASNNSCFLQVQNGIDTTEFLIFTIGFLAMPHIHHCSDEVC